MHKANSFITLTYSDENLPQFGTLVKSHFVNFMKKLRREIDVPIRFYMCGEYGEQTDRPHYHAIIFGYNFPDQTYHSTRRGNRVYRSKQLENCWQHGFSEIGTVTFQSAGYVARYILKKQTGEYGLREYGIPDDQGEIIDTKVPPYTTMSNRPGIGATWYEKNSSDLWPHDFAVLPDGRETSVPDYYRLLLERDDPELAESLRAARVAKAQANPDNTQARLEARHKVRLAKIKPLKRTL